MLSACLALLITTTPSTAEEGSAANPPPPAPPSAADSVVAAAFQPDIGTKVAALQESSPGASTFVAPGLALLALAALAFALSRKRAKSSRTIHLVESAALGPKRSLVIADVMGERLVLGVSEAGITVLSSRPSPAAEPEPFVIPPALVVPPAVTTPPAPTKMNFLDRMLGRVPAAAATTPQNFDEALRDSLEDQELRAKLALGQRSVVP